MIIIYIALDLEYLFKLSLNHLMLVSPSERLLIEKRATAASNVHLHALLRQPCHFIENSVLRKINSHASNIVYVYQNGLRYHAMIWQSSCTGPPNNIINVAKWIGRIVF